MTSYPKIGTINSSSLSNPINSTFPNCVGTAKGKEKFVAYNNNQCYMFSSYDPVSNNGGDNGIPVYAVPPIDCTDNLSDCLKTAGNTFLAGKVSEVDNLLLKNKNEKENLFGYLGSFYCFIWSSSS